MGLFRQGVFSLGLATMLVWLSGCFTEIGNAEDERLVKAEFKVDYSENPHVLAKTSAAVGKVDSIHINEFYLLVHEAEYTLKDSASGKVVTKHLWADDSLSDSVDFTGHDQNAILSVQKIGLVTPLSFTLGFKFPAHGNLNPSTIEYQSFHDLGFVKGVFMCDSVETEFLFSLPARTEVHLRYSQATLLSWLHGNTYDCEIAFFATKWVEKADLTKAVKVKDKNGHEFVLLDWNNNFNQYKAMVNAFNESFNTANVF